MNLCVYNVEQEQVTEQPDEAMAFDIPANINFAFKSDIQQVIFDRLPINNVKGLITARDEKLVLDDLSMQTLDGNVKMTGSYQNTPENQPLFDFTFNVAEVAIPKAFQTFSGLAANNANCRSQPGKSKFKPENEGTINSPIRFDSTNH
jgi:hypothetical protein